MIFFNFSYDVIDVSLLVNFLVIVIGGMLSLLSMFVMGKLFVVWLVLWFICVIGCLLRGCM